MEIAIAVKAAERRFGSQHNEVVALNAVTLDFAAGSFTAVMGPSGSGKSTLLNVIAGLEPLDAGEALIGGISIASLTDDARTVLRRESLGLIYQDFNLLPFLTAAENVALPLRLAGRTVREDSVRSLLDAVGMAGQADQLPSTLSGGQQQRVAIARAVATGPTAVLADEPTGALDVRSASDVLDLLRARVDYHAATVVMVTHDPVAASRADTVVFLRDGRAAGRLDRPTPRMVTDRLLELADLGARRAVVAR